MKKLLACFLGILLCTPLLVFGASVAASFGGTVAASTASSVATLQLAGFTVSSGTHLCLIAAVGTNGSTTALTVHWDTTGTNQLMQAGPVLTATSANKVAFFFLIDPTVTTGTMQADWTTSRAGAFIIAAAFKNTDHTNCIKTADNASANNTGTTPSITITSSTDGATMAVVGSQSSISSTDLGATEIFRGCTSGIRCAGSYYLGNASNTHQFTQGSATWTEVGVHILSDTPPSTCVKSFMLLGVGGC